MSERDHQQLEKRERMWVSEREFSRRDLLRGAGAAGAALGLGGILAACGGEEEAAAPPAPPTGETTPPTGETAAPPATETPPATTAPAEGESRRGGQTCAQG